MFVYFVMVVICFVNADFGPKNANNYGYYVVDWEKFDQCKGPKLKNGTEWTNRLYMNENNHYMAELNITFLEDSRIEEIKMYVYTLKEGTKRLLWNYNINKPCQHFMLSNVLEYNLKAKNCLVRKGPYYTLMDMSDLMAKYIGKQFFYGEYLFKVVMNAKKANLICIYFDPKFKKKAA